MKGTSYLTWVVVLEDVDSGEEEGGVAVAPAEPVLVPCAKVVLLPRQSSRARVSLHHSETCLQASAPHNPHQDEQERLNPIPIKVDPHHPDEAARRPGIYTQRRLLHCCRCIDLRGVTGGLHCEGGVWRGQVPPLTTAPLSDLPAHPSVSACVYSQRRSTPQP